MTRSVPFGKVEHLAWWTCQGQLPMAKVLTLGRELSLLTGMTLDGMPDVRKYPTEAGAGGEGVQVYFAWVESWMIVGTWPKLGLIRIAMSTCAVERFKPEEVTQFLEFLFGPVKVFGFAEW